MRARREGRLAAVDITRQRPNGETWRACDEQRGIRATRISAVTNKAVTDVGRDRYATLVALLRKDLSPVATFIDDGVDPEVCFAFSDENGSDVPQIF